MKHKLYLSIAPLILLLLLSVLFWMFSRGVVDRKPTLEQLDATISTALKRGEVVVVSVSAEWDLAGSLIAIEIQEDVDIKNWISEGKVSVHRADVSEKFDSIPSSLGISMKNQRLPLFVILSRSNPGKPIVLSGNSVSSRDVKVLIQQLVLNQANLN